jgi:hypothetical protein
MTQPILRDLGRLGRSFACARDDELRERRELVYIAGREPQKFGCNLPRSLYPSGPVHG